ncbi:MAG: phosphotriesterase [Verrucomicrobia bacterium]|nr:phosphotriesterase [Cytophagales bacterium]
MQNPRRNFLKTVILATGGSLLGFTNHSFTKRGRIINVTGAIKSSQMGITLIHEHILVDFIGADKTSSERWNHEDVIKKVLPYLEEVKKLGCQTLVDCTPAYLGRDVELLKKLAELSGLQILTNTGYYGAVDNKYLPPHAFTETDQQIANRWIAEFEKGIDNTNIKPGFMKISVNPEKLSALHQKLVRAAALTHLKTGLTICSHTGPALPAFEEIEILKQQGVHPSAFVWVHAQNEGDWQNYAKAARLGAWVSLDGVNEGVILQYVKMLEFLKKEQVLPKILISHDAGWYDPDKSDGGDFRGYTTIFKKLIPALHKKGFSDKEIKQLMVVNPAKAFEIEVRKLRK